MAKRSSGLPEGFKLQATREDLDAPVEVGDYLDQVVPVAPLPAVDRVVSLRPEPASSRSVETTEPPRHELPLTPAPASRGIRARAVEPEPDPLPVHQARLPRVHARKQINLNPNALATLEEVLARLREYSGQKDLASSELVTALVMAAAEALPHLDLTRLPRRGPWGSTAASNFPAHLKRSFINAIGQLYDANHREQRR